MSRLLHQVVNVLELQLSSQKREVPFVPKLRERVFTFSLDFLH